MKVQFIFPKNELRNNQTKTLEESIKLSPINQGIPFLGQLYLAAQIKEKLGWDVEIFYEEYTPKDKIIAKLNADFVGVSSWFNNHENALSYLEIAKQKGAVTLIGGPNASALSRKILDNNEYVDYVFIGDAENSLINLLSSTNRITRGIVKSELPNLDELPIVNLESLMDNKILIEQRENISMPTSAIRGCTKAITNGRCIFCSIPLKELRLMNPKRYFQQIRTMQERYGFVNFTETGDDLIIPEYLDALLLEKPNDLEINLYSQMGLEQITPKISSKLSKLGLKIAGIGLETFSPEIMQKVNKSREKMSEQIKYLILEGIKVRLYTLYGLPGENENSISYTYKKLSELVSDCPNGMIIRPKICFPLPGSTLFTQCLKKEELVVKYKQITGQNLKTEDKINHLILRELYLQHFTELSYPEITNLIEEQRRYLPMEVRPLYL
jgi:radical SAM superfamily enzyme YgiQ (UPF0313 family)